MAFSQLSTSRFLGRMTGIHIFPRNIPSRGEAWGYSILSVTAISIISLLLAMIILCIPPKKKLMSFVMSFILSLGVGILVGDAVLHLIPECLTFSDNETESMKREISWRGCTLCVGISLFFFIEKMLHTFTTHSHSKHMTHVHTPQGGQICNDLSRTATNLDSIHEVSTMEDPKHLENREVTVTYQPNPEEDKESSHLEVLHSQDINYPNNDEKNEGKYSIESLKKPPQDEIKHVTWFVIFGDALHNFIDGLAIAASFSNNTVQGLATSIAILLHEIPHELTDFAILLTSGMKKKKIILYNLFCTITAFLGLIVGMTVYSVSAFQFYVFALTAATFLYISLTNIIPELLHTNHTFIFIAIETGAMLLGIAIMLLIAFYGEDL
jgi:zinc transporter ZupT